MLLQSSLATAIPIRPSRQCWECQRRRRHCDFSRPACNKCQAAGIVCPGYEDKKPLTWLAPGTVLSRPRKGRKSPPRPRVPETKDSLNGQAARLTVEMASSLAIPIFNWRDETTAIIEAIYYYNSQIYSSLSPTLDLGYNPYIIKLLPEYLPYFSIAYQHCLACLAISHRIRQLPQGFSSILLNQTWQRLYHHRAIAIREIRECIARGKYGITTQTTYDIFALMCAELQFSPIGTDWRLHYEGFMKVVALRGGFENLLRSDNIAYKYALLGFIIIGIMANTTAPASSQTAASTYFSSINFISEIYKNVIYPTMLCPPELLMCIIEINYLRHQIAKSTLSIEEGQTTAMALAQKISDFSLEKWVESDATLRELWLIIGQIYHSAVLLFCIVSLQDLSLLPKDQQFRSRKATHCELLFRLLPQAMKAPQLMPSMSWPLVVAGMHARGDNTVHRPYITAELLSLSRESGVGLPLLATTVLEKYWASGEESWDECFGQGYVFVW